MDFLTAVSAPGIAAMGAAAVGLVLVAGLVAGQFRRGVVDELRATINTANTEIEIERGRSDRLEREAAALRMEVEGLRKEVQTLRSVMLDDRKLAKTIAEELAQQRRHEVEELKEAMGMYTIRIIEAFKEG